MSVCMMGHRWNGRHADRRRVGSGEAAEAEEACAVCQGVRVGNLWK